MDNPVCSINCHRNVDEEQYTTLLRVRQEIKV